MELNQLNELFNEIIGWNKSISADMALDCATRIYNSKNISSKSSTKDDSDQPRATDKQIAYLKQLNYKGDTDLLSIQEAKHLIQELKSKK